MGKLLSWPRFERDHLVALSQKPESDSYGAVSPSNKRETKSFQDSLKSSSLFSSLPGASPIGTGITGVLSLMVTIYSNGFVTSVNEWRTAPFI
ncbi:hypothetical protein BaRGS_00002916 [Batillaria attramentaria]|uniref:Uncharacterized protein n=1 Tax=Batillaria attramentaria TaxID=370345 RepID=A0ABD0M1M8_9CAEN